MSQTLPVLRLKSGEDRRLRAGHLWVYSNEVEISATPLKSLEPGTDVIIEDARGKPLGRAYANPHSLICARLYSRQVRQALDLKFFKQMISQAVTLREHMFQHACYRAVFGESDLLPGLVIDRFGDTFVIQSGTAGMDRALPLIAEAIDQLYAPNNIVVKSEGATREQEGLADDVRALKGDLPQQIELIENGVNFVAPLEQGQKTGWFYDHRAARRRIMPLASEARVLDVFSYCGAWGVLAATTGAASVTCLDASERALDFVHLNAEKNKVQDKFRTVQADAATGMKELLAEGEKFDLVIIDPPAFIKRKKDFKNGLGAYHQINELALRLVASGGVLVSASCSMHLGREQLLEVMRSSARHHDRYLQVFASEGQAQDHPVHPAIVETNYLKSWFGRVLMNP